jgi:hypothetical protein
MANNSINLVDLDFNSLKTSLISYLKNQEQFKDYDFEGSNLNVLIDLLSYNSFKNTFFLNMIAAEAFLDSAQMENSIISHAKELNYTPRSRRSAKATIQATFQATGTNQPYTIPKGSSFTSIVKNDLYTFTTAETISVSSANTTFTFTTDVYEGSYFQDSYLYNDQIEFPKFRITNKDVDTSSLTVVVYEDNSEIGVNYKLASTLLDLKETSKVFFLQSSQNGYYEIVFGDGVLGQKPKNNSIILLDYRVSKGKLPNGARSFTFNFDPTFTPNDYEGESDVTVLTIAQNGEERESIESVRFYAPRHFQVQERAVTTSDYEILLKTEFPEINNISVYGGEDLTPPQYGKVFVAVDIFDVQGLPDSKKNEFYNFLKRRSPLSIDPVFVEPDYLYYKINCHVRYNLNSTLLSKERIKTLVTNTIIDYNNINLDDFNVTLRYSKLISAIDNSDSSIVSNSTDIQVYKKVPVLLGTAQNIVINFNLRLRNDVPELASKHPASDVHTIKSSVFTYNGEKVILEDNGEGTVVISKFDNLFNIRLFNIGTIDYDKGIIRLNNFIIDNYEGLDFKIYAYTADKDISSTTNTVLTLEPSELNITTETVRV